MIKTVKIEITADETAFDVFADELKYQDLVSKSSEELALLTEPISIQDRLKPNPQSKMDYVLSYLNKVTVDELVKVKNQVIDNQIIDAKEAEKEAMRVVIGNAVVVTAS